MDAPLGEEVERYRLHVLAGETVLRALELWEPQFAYAAAMASEDLAAGGGAVTIEVAQVGVRGMGQAVTMTVEA